MTTHANAIRLRLAAGPKSGSQVAAELGLSQPTVSRALAAMGAEVVKVGQRKSTRYLLRDLGRGFGEVPVYRVDTTGKLQEWGTLSPVRPDGFVWTQAHGVQVHSEGLPWWLVDMRPQGFLGRALATRLGAELGLPSSLPEWTDSHAMRALLAHGHDVVGNLLIGPTARDTFVSQPEPVALTSASKPEAYARMALSASTGAPPGSSAGGAQPKFAAYAELPRGARHVIVKFSEGQPSPNSVRWRDILLAEHLALEALRQAGVAAAHTAILDHQGQRFLEVERFDRVGALGRQALVSLGALDAEFAGLATQPWPVVTRSLAKQGVITPQASEVAEVLWAFGSLIGNTDMHPGNLSFVSEHGPPFEVAPAYDMTPMAFAPTSSGRLPDTIPPITLHAAVRPANWRRALQVARTYLDWVKQSSDFNSGFRGCIQALEGHVERVGSQIGRLG